MDESRLIFGLLFALLGVFGYLTLLVTVVLIAEFIRRERTETTDDDWIQRRKRD